MTHAYDERQMADVPRSLPAQLRVLCRAARALVAPPAAEPTPAWRPVLLTGTPERRRARNRATGSSATDGSGRGLNKRRLARPRRPAGDRRAVGRAVPPRLLAVAGRLPRRRRLLRHQRVPDHEPAGDRDPRNRPACGSARSTCAAPAACCRRCLRCCSSSASPATRSGATSWPRSRAACCRAWPTSRTGGSSPITSRTSSPPAGRRCCSTSGRWRSRSSSTSSGRSS